MSTTQPIRSRQKLLEFKRYYLEIKPNFRNYALIILGLNTALRIGDILKITWGMVYDDKNCRYRTHLSVIEQKTGKENTVALNASAREALELQRQVKTPKQEDFLFPSQKNRLCPISRCQAFRIVKKAAAASGLSDHVSCHSLRKTFGYHAWKGGTPPAMLMHIYNHSSYRITQRYLGIGQEEKDEVFYQIKI